MAATTKKTGAGAMKATKMDKKDTSEEKARQKAREAHRDDAGDNRTHEKQLLAREIRQTSNKHRANTVLVTT